MSKPSQKRKTIAAISFGSTQRLKKAVKRSEKLHGKRGLSRYMRQLVDADTAANP